MAPKKKSLPTKMDLYNPHMVPHTIPQGNYNFPRGTNKIQIFDEISTSGKIYQFNEEPKIWWWVWGGGGGGGLVGGGGLGGGGGLSGIWGAWCAGEGCCGWWREDGWWHR